MMGRAARIVALVAAMGFATACEPPRDGKSTEGEQGLHVTNGMEDLGDPAVVALLASPEVASCSGTLVAPRVIVTAGHCIRVGQEQVFFGNALAEGGIIRDVIDARAHPRFDPATLMFDVGVLLLAEDAPVEPIRMWTGSFDDDVVGRAVRFVGFGRTSVDDMSPAIRRLGYGTVGEVDDQKYKILPNPSQTCVGDSGGAGFFTDDGVDYLSGVVSSGDPMCMEFARFARIDLALEQFIEPYIALTRPGSQTVGEVCYFDEQCVTGTCVRATDDPRLRYCSRECNGIEDCLMGMDCEGGLCRHRPPTPGVLGTPCEHALQCASNVCLAGEEGEQTLCSTSCLDDIQCGEGMLCENDEPAQERGFCVAEPQGDGCSLADGQRGDAAGTVLLVILAALLASRRHRSH